MLKGRISAREGVEFCYEMRNKIMAEHRKLTSVPALAKAEQYKKTPPTLPQLFEKYATDTFGQSCENLSADRRSRFTTG